jgi:Zn-dependent protease
MLFTFQEIIDAVVMSFVVGLIFSDFFARFNARGKQKGRVFVKTRSKDEIEYDPIEHHSRKTLRLGPLNINWDDMKFAIMIIAPAIILHELGHKFVAMAYGAEATFHISYMFLGIALLLKMFNSPFIFLVPAFVAYPNILTPLQGSAVAFAGPAVNLILFAVSALILKYAKKLTERQIALLALTKKVNLFLAIFNMIPISPFDGGHVIEGLVQTFL